MRKIEAKMVAAIKAGKPFTKDNTTVVIAGRYYSVLLFGNWIARGVIGNVPGYINLCGWASNTTMSRLRALGLPICRKDGVPRLYGRGVIPVNDWVGTGKGMETPLV